MWFAFGETKKKDLLLYMVPNDRCPAIFRRQRMEFSSKTCTDKLKSIPITPKFCGEKFKRLRFPLACSRER